MISKNDLVKRFEETTKQEMINHNNAIAQYANSLNAVRDSINQLNKQQKLIANALKSDMQKDKDLQFHKNAEFQERIQQTQSLCNDVLHICEENVLSYNEMVESVNEIQKTKVFIQNRYDEMRIDLRDNKGSIKLLEGDLQDKIERAKYDFDKKFTKLSDQLDKPSVEHNALAQSFTEKVSEIECNHSGNVKEIDLLKKDIRYMKKQIENIYTLLERINTKIEG